MGTATMEKAAPRVEVDEEVVRATRFFRNGINRGKVYRWVDEGILVPAKNADTGHFYWTYGDLRDAVRANHWWALVGSNIKGANAPYYATLASSLNVWREMGRPRERVIGALNGDPRVFEDASAVARAVAAGFAVIAIPEPSHIIP